MTKSTIIRNLIDYYVSPSWQGKNAQEERCEWKKELQKESKDDLLARLSECQS